MASYYIDSSYFSAATSVYLDIGLNSIAPDGYYSNSGTYRQQSGGLLISGTSFCTLNNIIANNDSYSAYVTQGINGYNILANDTLGASGATTSNVVISQLSTTDPSVNINTTTGAVVVTTGTSVGSYLISYQICELGNISNCDNANIFITIDPLPYSGCMNFDSTCELACVIPPLTGF